MLPPARRGKYVLLTLILTLVSSAAFIAYNSGYLFHTKLYEVGDPGANSLSVIRASHFQQLYGTYSRWGFHHPGPFVFYYSAALEGIFYRWLHVMPTPYNAQVMGSIILTLFFLLAGVCVAARWVQSRFFPPLALVLAALHFTAVDLRFVMFSTWPACVLPLVFFCLLVAAASVAAGQGDDLPLLVTAGSFAIHSHVAQPLFALPMFGLGYLGLSWSCYQRARAARTGNEPLRFAPWRFFPWAHGSPGCWRPFFCCRWGWTCARERRATSPWFWHTCAARPRNLTPGSTRFTTSCISPITGPTFSTARSRGTPRLPAC